MPELKTTKLHLTFTVDSDGDIILTGDTSTGAVDAVNEYAFDDMVEDVRTDNYVHVKMEEYTLAINIPIPQKPDLLPNPTHNLGTLDIIDE